MLKIGDSSSAFYAFILLLVLPLALCSPDSGTLNKNFIPLVAVPGYLGSELSWSGPSYNGCDASSSPVQWWVSVDQLVVHHECLAPRVGSSFTFADSSLPFNLPEISFAGKNKIETTGDSGFAASGKLHGEVYFDAPKAMLEKIGYTPCTDPNMDYCDFDVASWLWPYAPMSYYQSFNDDKNQPLFADIKFRVERMYHRTGKKVALLGHSEGGMSITHFLLEQDQEWLDTYIEQGIFVAPAFCTFETVSAPIFGLVGGYNLAALTDLPGGSSMVSDVVNVTRSWPSAFIMWPLEFVYPNDTVIVSRYSAYGSFEQNYTLGNYIDALKSYGLEDSVEIYKAVTKYNQRLQWHPRVKSYVYSGSQHPTPMVYDVTDDYFGDGLRAASVASHTDGDQTLPLKCVATYANHWLKNDTYYTNYTDVPGMIHANFIGTNAGVLSWINRLCLEEPCIGIDHSTNDVCAPGFACKDGVASPCSASNVYAPGYANIECLPVPDGYVKVSNDQIKLIEMPDKTTNKTAPHSTKKPAKKVTDICPANFYCVDNVAHPCPANSYSPVNSTSVKDCISCAENEFIVEGENKCSKLLPGYYLSGHVQSLCPIGFSCTLGKLTPCTLNSYQPNKGAETCLPIPQGYYAILDNGVNIAIQICTPGNSCSQGFSTPCAGNQYQPNEGGSTCLVCPVGSAIDAAHSSCTVCSSEFACNGGTTKIKCDDHQLAINGTCTSCSWYQYVDRTTGTCVDFWDGFAKSGNSQIACKAGTACVNGVITKCTGNTYSLDGAAKCITCPNNQVANSNNTGCDSVTATSLSVKSTSEHKKKSSHVGLICGLVFGLGGGLAITIYAIYYYRTHSRFYVKTPI